MPAKKATDSKQDQIQFYQWPYYVRVENMKELINNMSHKVILQSHKMKLYRPVG